MSPHLGIGVKCLEINTLIELSLNWGAQLVPRDFQIHAHSLKMLLIDPEPEHLIRLFLSLAL